MTKGLNRSLERSSDQRARIVTKRIQVDHAMSIDGATGIGFGGVHVGGLPEGNILLLGARATLTFSGTGSLAELAQTWDGDFGVGSTLNADTTLGTTEVNVIPSTATGPASSEVSPTLEVENVTPSFIDNTAGATGLFINLLVDDASIAGDGVPIQATGDINIAYIVMGDS